MLDFQILYVQPFDNSNYFTLLYNFFRISNYLNSKKEQLNANLMEDYFDLRFESSPPFQKRNRTEYIQYLKNFLGEKLNKTDKNIVAISCYSSYCYLNAVYIACTVKQIKPDALVIVGGVHSSLFPNEFQFDGVPDIIKEDFHLSSTPFDFLIQWEGEKPFFELIKDYINVGMDIKKIKKDFNNCEIITNEDILDLNELPLIDISLAQKYSANINRHNHIYLEFSRGCPNKCKFCIGSLNINCYYKIRVKNLEKCIKELEIINKTEWLNVEYIDISDPLFLPIRREKNQFFEKFGNFKEKEDFQLKLQVLERVDSCTLRDLEYYKDLGITPLVGVESFSKTLLNRIGKLHLINHKAREKYIEKYLEHTRVIIKKTHELDLPAVFYYVVGVPGTDESTLKEDYEFLFNKEEDGRCLAEKYKFYISFFKYTAYPSSEFFFNPDKSYGSVNLIPFWWRKFNEDQMYLNEMVDPSRNMNLLDALDKSDEIIRKFIGFQHELGNSMYDFKYMISYKKVRKDLIDKYKQYS